MNCLYEVLILVLVLVALYTIIPDLLLHHLGIGSWKRQNRPGVAITFDDGPNPEVTPQILAILARYHVTATFFVVGEKAAHYPDLVRAIYDAGHQIGLHSQYHRYAWFISPWATWREWEECTSTVERIIGQTVKLVRPPWGTFNLVTWYWMKIRKKQAVLWTAEGHDWQARRKPEQIIESILERTREGTIVVLHDDGGENGAPQNTLNALGTLCTRIVEEKELPLVKLELPECQ